MKTKKMALALCTLLAAVALLPVAQGAHYTLYYDIGPMQAPFATFEGNDKGAVPHGNQNGPAGQETRPIPAQSDIPPRFHGLADTLVGTHSLDPAVWGPGIAILDHYMYGSAVEAGQLVPYGYFLSEATGAPRTSPTSMHALWFGKWNDANGDGVINDKHCGATHTPCDAADEFVWRGKATGEAFTGVAYFFPGDYDGSTGTLALHTGSGLAGHCGDYGANNPDCIRPGVDMSYADSTADGAGNSRWAGNNGGGQFTAEESLVVSQHIVTLVGPTATIKDPASDEGYHVDGTIAQGIYRDYDYYEALAGSGIESMYLSSMRGVRDTVWVPFVVTTLRTVNDILNSVGGCPDTVPGEDYGCWDRSANSHNEAVAGVNSEGTSALKTWAYQRFRTPVPAYASTPSPIQQEAMCQAAASTSCPAYVPKQGFYGDFWWEENLLQPVSSFGPGAWVRPELEAWYWKDKNNDGRIGTFDPDLEAAYNSGIAPNPNNGLCNIDNGNHCELIPAADIYDGKTVSVSPGSAGWPPGTFKMNRYEDNWEGPPLGAGPDPWIESATPLFGTNSVSLRADPERCTGTFFSCRTIDALFIPTGTALGLNGQVNGGAVFSWNEADQAYVVTWPGSFSASI